MEKQKEVSQIHSSYIDIGEATIKLFIPSITLRTWARKNKVIYIRTPHKLLFEINSLYLQKNAKDILSLKNIRNRATTCAICGKNGYPIIYFYHNKDLLPIPLCFSHYFEKYLEIINLHES